MTWDLKGYMGGSVNVGTDIPSMIYPSTNSIYHFDPSLEVVYISNRTRPGTLFWVINEGSQNCTFRPEGGGPGDEILELDVGELATFICDGPNSFAGIVSASLVAPTKNVFANPSIIAFGGTTTPRNSLKYTVSTNAWAALGATIAVDYDFSAIIPIGDFAYGIGGRTSGTLGVARMSLIAVALGAVGAFPTAVSGAASLRYQELGFVIGGQVSSTAVAASRKYDSPVDTWITLSDMPHARDECAGVSRADRGYLFAGSPVGSNHYQLDHDGDVYRTLPSHGTSREKVAAETVGTGILLTGGILYGDTDTYYDDAYFLDPITEAWASKTARGTETYESGTAKYGEDELLLMGGKANTDSDTLLASSYDETTNAWTARTSMTSVDGGLQNSCASLS